MRDAAWSVFQRYAVVLALATAAALPFVYVQFGTTAFADGSLFELSILSPSPWTLLWANYPSRVSAFVTTILPPFATARLTGSADAALAVYRMIMGGLPLLSLLLTIRLAGIRSLLATGCAVSTILAAYCVAFFPTELWLTHAAFWPLAALVLNPPGMRPGPLLLASLFVVFTHEAAVPIMALVLAAAAIRHRGYAIPLVALIAIALPVAVKLWAPIPNTHIARSVHANALVFLTPNFLSNTMFDRAMIAAAASAAAILVIGARYRAATICVCATIAAAAIISMMVVPGDLHVLRRYLSRTLVFASLVVAAGTMLAWAIAERWLPRLAAIMKAQAQRSSAAAALIFSVAITVSAGGHVIETTRFLHGWSQLSAALSGSMQPLPSGLTSLDMSGHYRNGAGPVRSSAWEVAWNWSLPFQWAVTTGGTSHGSLPFRPTAPFAPIDCLILTTMNPGGFLLHPDRFALLRRHMCQIEVERDEDRLLP
ncbi:MAG: hypothetical protein LCH88_15845 [Proteobacteria bacterium]|nr:hypothetical protein [Pseudomonadota bacterium]